MKEKESTISQQIYALSNPTPEGDIEDFWDEDTSARVVSADYNEASPDESHDLEPSSLRRRVALDLQDDQRYKGLRTSRAKLETFSDEDKDDDDDDDADDDQEEEGEESVQKRKQALAERLREMAENFEDDDSEAEEDGSELESDDEDDDDENEDENQDEIDDEEDDDISDEDDVSDDEDEDDDEDEEDIDLGDDSGIQRFSDVNISEDVEKGKAVKAQLGLWDSFMQARIKMQKALSIANQLPQFDTHELFMSECGEEVRALMNRSERELNRLLQSFIHLQDSLLNQNPETQHILHGEEPGKESNLGNGGDDDDDDDDEEIPSDTDDEGDKDPAATKRQTPKRVVEKRVLDDDEIPEHLAKRHKSFEPFRNSTVQKWYEKTRLSTGKLSKKSFSGFERSALLQIQQVLQDKDRLIKRTQLRRSEYTVLGQRSKKEEDGEQEGNEEEKEDIPQVANQHLKNYDEEIFDDDDFYHQLLRELIEKRTSSVTDPVQLTRQWLQVQKLRRKVKRLVDTKASKGRKLRYDVHQKLVSFMAPVDQSNMTAEARTELYKSLFGQSTTTSLVER